MTNSDKINQTITDLEVCKNGILERHKEDTSFCLRINSVFTQLANSLSYNTGSVNATEKAFVPQPLENVLGMKIAFKKTTKMNLAAPEVDEVEAFKEKIQLIYDGFLTRENPELKESLEEIEVRGVAKLAGIDNFATAKIDGTLLNRIKKAITTKNELAAAQEVEKANLNPETEEAKKIRLKAEYDEFVKQHTELPVDADLKTVLELTEKIEGLETQLIELGVDLAAKEE